MCHFCNDSQKVDFILHSLDPSHTTKRSDFSDQWLIIVTKSIQNTDVQDKVLIYQPETSARNNIPP